MSATSKTTGKSAARRREESFLESFRSASRATRVRVQPLIVEPDSGGDQRPGHAGTPRLIRAAHIPGALITVKRNRESLIRKLLKRGSGPGGAFGS